MSHCHCHRYCNPAVHNIYIYMYPIFIIYPIALLPHCLFSLPTDPLNPPSTLLIYVCTCACSLLYYVIAQFLLLSSLCVYKWAHKPESNSLYVCTYFANKSDSDSDQILKIKQILGVLFFLHHKLTNIASSYFI